MVSTRIDWLQNHHQWPGLAAIGKVVRIRETPDKTSTETAYYLLSKALSAERFNEVVRQHWSVENRLHWRLDVIMNEFRSEFEPALAIRARLRSLRGRLNLLQGGEPASVCACAASWCRDVALAAFDRRQHSLGILRRALSTRSPSRIKPGGVARHVRRT